MLVPEGRLLTVEPNVASLICIVASAQSSTPIVISTLDCLMLQDCVFPCSVTEMELQNCCKLSSVTPVVSKVALTELTAFRLHVYSMSLFPAVTVLTFVPPISPGNMAHLSLPLIIYPVHFTFSLHISSQKLAGWTNQFCIKPTLSEPDIHQPFILAYDVPAFMFSTQKLASKG